MDLERNIKDLGDWPQTPDHWSRSGHPCLFGSGFIAKTNCRRTKRMSALEGKKLLPCLELLI